MQIAIFRWNDNCQYHFMHFLPFHTILGSAASNKCVAQLIKQTISYLARAFFTEAKRLMKAT